MRLEFGISFSFFLLSFFVDFIALEPVKSVSVVRYLLLEQFMIVSMICR